MERPGEFTKCPCCANPWNAEGVGSFAMACEPCKKSTSGVIGVDPEDFDEFVSPVDDFYNFAIGGWRTKNPIPPEYPSWNCFTILHDLNQKRLKEMVDELESKEGAQGTEKKVADYWATCMDEEAINKRGIEPLQPLLDAVQPEEIEKDVTAVFAQLFKWGCSGVFSFYESPDKKQSEWSIGQIGQSGLGLPDRDYYTDEDKEDKRVAYKKHVAEMLVLLGDDAAAAEASADAIFGLEMKIASCHWTRTELRDPEKTYNKMTVEDLQAKVDNVTGGGGINFARWFELVGKPVDALGAINVSAPEPVVETCRLVKEADFKLMSDYLRWKLVKNFAAFDLPTEFGDKHFAFFQTTLQGTKERKPRWKRAIQKVEGVLGEALGELYVGKYFNQEAKAAALLVVERVRAALKERLEEVVWMSDQTREKAMLKMNKFGVKIGFPDKWIDYSSLEIVRGDHFGNELRACKFELDRLLGYTNAPVDRDRWYMTPQTINAYYHPSLNEIVFPAAILQPPFFSKEADDAINFGAMGAVVGHEMTHGFDDQGRKYDHTGNMVDWWTEEDGKEYERRVEVMVAQAEKFVVYDMPLKGKLTCGENIADLGGLKLAYRALCAKLKEQGLEATSKETQVGGFTAQQRFFLSWAKVWAQNIEKEMAIQRVTTDPHGPNEFRVNGPLANIPEFHSAFLAGDGCKMFVPPEQRVDIW